MVTHRMLGRTRNSQGILIGTARANPGKNVSASDASGRSGAREAAEDGVRSAAIDRRRCADFDRRRRHAQDGQQVQAVSREAAAGCAADSGRASCRRRSTTTTAASTSRSAISRRSISWQRGAQSDCRRRGESRVLPGRIDGPQCRLAGVRRGDCRRGEPGDQRRRHRRPVRVDAKR